MANGARPRRETTQDPAISAVHAPGPRSGDVVYGSRELFRGGDELVIEHEGSRYRLRITRQGKLILNK